ncbi:hypothetical protein RFI_29975, partial [Reticulomyxa filosa]
MSESETLKKRGKSAIMETVEKEKQMSASDALSNDSIKQGAQVQAEAEATSEATPEVPEKVCGANRQRISTELSKKMNNRKSIQALIRAGILKDPGTEQRRMPTSSSSGGSGGGGGGGSSGGGGSGDGNVIGSDSKNWKEAKGSKSAAAAAVSSSSSPNQQDKENDLGFNRKEMFRRLTKHDLTEFLAHRPSIDELVNANMVQDVMTWTQLQMKGVTPRPRNCHCTCLVDKSVYLVGGYGTGNTSIDLLVTDIAVQHWYRPLVGGVVPSERYAHTCVSVGTYLFVFGGFCVVSGKWLNDLHVLDTEYKQELVPSLSAYGATSIQQSPMLVWYQPQFTGEPPVCRASHAAAVINHKMFIFGGNNNQKLFNDLHVLDTRDMKWTQPVTQGTPPCPRAGHTMAAVGHCLFVFGGSNGQKPLNDLFVFDTTTNTWKRPKANGTPPSPRGGHSMCVIRKTQLLVFAGGFLPKMLNDLHMFDTLTYTWSRPKDTGAVPSARAGHSCVVTTKDFVHVIGGGDVDKELFNDHYLLDTGYFLKKKEDAARSKVATTTAAVTVPDVTITTKKLHDVVTALDSANLKQLSTDALPTSISLSGIDAAVAKSRDGHIIDPDLAFIRELQGFSHKVETYVNDAKKDMEKKVCEFRQKEEAYLNVLRIIDADREKLVDDVMRQCNDIHKETQVWLHDLNAKFQTRSLQKQLWSIKQNHTQILTNTSSATLDPHTVTVPSVPALPKPTTSKSAKKKKKKKKNGAKSDTKGPSIQSDTQLLSSK